MISIKKISPKVVSLFLSFGAAASTAFLAFVGALAMPLILPVGIVMMGLAFIFEWQVYNEGITTALKRILDKNYLKKALGRRYIKEELKKLNLAPDANPKEIPNIFLATYLHEKRTLEHLEHQHHLTLAEQEKKSRTKKYLADLELQFIQAAEITPITDDQFQKHLNALVAGREEALRNEFYRKKWLIRFSWIFALAGGVASGFAALSAAQASIAVIAVSFTALSAIPGGVLIALAAVAALGYMFMVYQTMTDVIQTYNSTWKSYLLQGENEYTPYYALRLIGIGLVVGLGIFATVATAGTWWFATQKGALILQAGSFVADRVRDISVPLMAIGTGFFNLRNSLSSFNEVSELISKGAIGTACKSLYQRVNHLLQTENPLQVINPFRLMEKALRFIKDLFFVGHVASDGLASDQLLTLPAAATMTLVAANQGWVESHYVYHSEHEHEHGEGHIHSHESKLLNAIFYPVKPFILAAKILSAGWDAAAIGLGNLFTQNKKPYQNYFTPIKEAFYDLGNVFSAGDKHEHHGHGHHGHGHSHAKAPSSTARMIQHGVANGEGMTHAEVVEEETKAENANSNVVNLPVKVDENKPLITATDIRRSYTNGGVTTCRL